MRLRPSPHSISPETIAQAGAGALLIAVAVVELALAFWPAGWWHRGTGLGVAFAGAVLVASAARTVRPGRLLGR